MTMKNVFSWCACYVTAAMMVVKAKEDFINVIAGTSRLTQAISFHQSLVYVIVGTPIVLAL